MNIQGVSISRQRPSCSGFETAYPEDIKTTDVVEYTFDMVGDEIDVARKITTPINLMIWRAECVTSQNQDPSQYVRDSDFDGVGDLWDADPNDPNVQ